MASRVSNNRVCVPPHTDLQAFQLTYSAVHKFVHGHSINPSVLRELLYGSIGHLSQPLWRFKPSCDSLSGDKISKRCNEQLMGVFSRGNLFEDVGADFVRLLGRLRADGKALFDDFLYLLNWFSLNYSFA